jgi:predicted tellurium resistance membrane protein TerC
MDILLDPNIWLAFVTLTALEVVLGIDNIIFISILVDRLPRGEQALARNLGLGAAMFTRIALLLSITWIMGLTGELTSVAGRNISGRDLILLGGGLFLIAKSTMEIHESLEGEEDGQRQGGARAGFVGVILQIAIIDIVFSFDSVITAVGLVQQVGVMIAAIVASMLVMLAAAGAVGDFVARHPTIKMLALSFLILIGIALVGEALEFHMPKGYIYFAMAFSVTVEMLNIRVRRVRAKPVHLRRHAPGERN